MERNATRPHSAGAEDSTSRGLEDGAAHVTRPATFLIVDDQPVVSFAMRNLLSSQPGWSVVAHVTTLDEARIACNQSSPVVVLLDRVRPGDREYAFISWVRDHAPSTVSVVYGGQPELVYAQRCIRSGAAGYVGRAASVDVLLYTISLVLNGETVVNGHVIDRLTTNFVRSPSAEGIESLSQRELEVLHLLGQGMSNHKIAQLLCRSAKTIESHRYRIAQKLKISGGAELVHFALRHEIASDLLAPGCGEGAEQIG